MNEVFSQFEKVRSITEEICKPLEIEDYVVQSCDDVSPPKWHLAHTTWLYENFFLKQFYPNYQFFNSHYNYLFNSYYQTFGKMWTRPKRGLLSRPTVKEVLDYRKVINKRVSEACAEIMKRSDSEIQEAKRLLLLGIHHEQQHQELILMDIKSNLAQSLLYPTYQQRDQSQVENAQQESRKKPHYIEIQGGKYFIGANSDDAFSYDQERPRHEILVQDFKICSAPVTNGEYLEFIEAGGYKDFQYWHDDGWSVVQSEKWNAPLYWQKKDQKWYCYTLNGYHELVAHHPVCHVSYFEACAFAKWSGKRLPTEQEWEVAAYQSYQKENFKGSHFLNTKNLEVNSSTSFFGNVWEWTMSAFLPYPRYQAPEGIEAEYNSKFMSGRMVLRGGSFATPEDHFRISYRNFYQPDKRWAFSGFRLGEDGK